MVKEEDKTLGGDLDHFAPPDPRWEEMLPIESVPLGVGVGSSDGLQQGNTTVRTRIAELSGAIWKVYHLTFSLWLPNSCFQLPRPSLQASGIVFSSLCASQPLACWGLHSLVLFTA